MADMEVGDHDAVQNVLQQGRKQMLWEPMSRFVLSPPGEENYPKKASERRCWLLQHT